MRSRRSLLRALALATNAVAAACACPKVTTSQFVIDEDLSQPPPGDYQLRGCFARDPRLPVECAYRDPRSGAVVVVTTPAPPLPPCDDEDGDACPAPPTPPPDPGFAPGAYRGRCEFLSRGALGHLGTLTCTYQGPRGTTASYERSELRDVRDGYDRFFCELDDAGTSLSCWHTRYEHCHAMLRPGTALRA